MRRPHHAALLLLAAAALMPAPAAANDSTFGGQGAELIPLQETRVRMAAEDITLEQRGDRWHITALYTFENPTDEVVTLQLGFPEEHCHPDADCAADGGHFRDMVTTVRGQAVPQKTGTVDPKNDWAPHLGRVFLYTVTFQPRERVQVTHRYNHAMSVSVDGPFITYITRTGALWSGPIGEARFTIRAAQRPWVLLHPRAFQLAAYTERLIAPKTPLTEIVFAMKQWTPREDLYVNLAQAQFGLNAGCPGTFFFVGATPEDELRAELRDLSDDALRVCRNLPYAHHGYIFKDKDLADAFRDSDTPPSPGEDNPLARVTYAPNPHFTPDLLTLAEHRYIKLIKDEEKRRKKPSK